MLIPITAKALSTVESFSLPFFGPNFVIQASLPFSWHILFFSSVAFAVAGLIYTWKCPLIVNRYDRFSQMEVDLESEVACEVVILTSYFNAISHNFRDDISHISGVADEWQKEFPSPSGNKFNCISPANDNQIKIELGDYKLAPKHHREAFRRAYSQSNKMHSTSRLSCVVTYAIGFVLLGILALQNIFYVVKQLG